MRLICRALRFGVVFLENMGFIVDAKNITYGETAIDKLVQALRTGGQPQDITKLTERYLEILREMVMAEERSSAS